MSYKENNFDKQDKGFTDLEKLTFVKSPIKCSCGNNVSLRFVKPNIRFICKSCKKSGYWSENDYLIANKNGKI